MLVVNLFGEPGAGKSVTAAGVFYELSINGFKVELITEVAKGYVWEALKDNEGNHVENPILSQQILLLGKQNRLLERLKNKRDIVITDSPLILSAIYKPENYFKSFENLVLEQFHAYNNFNIFLERTHRFDPEGRIHTEKQSKDIKRQIKDFLHKHNIPYIEFKTNKNINVQIFNKIKETFFDKKML